MSDPDDDAREAGQQRRLEFAPGGARQPDDAGARGPDRDPARERRSRELAFAMARVLHDQKCESVVVLDLRGRSQVTDYFVVASGTSQRQMRSACVHAEEDAETMGFAAHRSNLNERDSNWFVLDFVDVVAHVFEPETRLFYDLEMLWGDADRVDWKRGTPDEDDGPDPDDPRNRAGLRPDDVLPEQT